VTDRDNIRKLNKEVKNKIGLPIKHVLFYRWTFNGSNSLDKIAQNLKREHFQTVKPEGDDNILAVASENRPPILLFIFIQRESNGGELVLLQTSLGSFPFSAFRKHLGIIEQKAGITILK